MVSERVMLQAGRTTTISCWLTVMRFEGWHHARVSLRSFVGGVDGLLWRHQRGRDPGQRGLASEHLKHSAISTIQIDEGYQYARGEYVPANATQFPMACALWDTT